MECKLKKSLEEKIMVESLIFGLLRVFLCCPLSLETHFSMHYRPGAPSFPLLLRFSYKNHIILECPKAQLGLRPPSLSFSIH